MRLLLALKSSILQCLCCSIATSFSELNDVERKRSENKINYIARTCGKRLLTMSWLFFWHDIAVAQLLFCAWFCSAFRSLSDGRMKNYPEFLPPFYWKSNTIQWWSIFRRWNLIAWDIFETNWRHWLASRMHLLLHSFFASNSNWRAWIELAFHVDDTVS